MSVEVPIVTVEVVPVAEVDIIVGRSASRGSTCSTSGIVEQFCQYKC